MAWSEEFLLQQAAGFLWPFIRLGAMLISLPTLSGHSVPRRVRVILAMAIAWLVMPLLPAPPKVELFSVPALLIAAQEVVIGLTAGSILQLAFAATVFGGQLIGTQMGLGFASLVDPQTGVQSTVLSQFFLMLATLLFLQMDGFLVLIELMVDGFKTLPVGGEGLSRTEYWHLAQWGGEILAAGVLLSLPVVCALLLINLGFGVASRAAPQLNLFSVGFPLTLLIGLVLIWMLLPDCLHLFSGLLAHSFEIVRDLLAGP